MLNKKESDAITISENLTDDTPIRRFIAVFLLVIFVVLLSNYFFGKTPTTPIIASTVIDASANVDGIADPFSHVTISTNNGISIQTQTDEKGRFMATLPLSDPGEYLVTAQTSNNRLVENTQSQVKLKYDPSLKSMITRRVTVFLSYRQIGIDLLVVLPRDNEDAVNLLTGKIKFKDFVNNVFSPSYKVRNHDISEWFEGVKPTIAFTPTFLTFRASSTQKSESAVHTFDSILEQKALSESLNSDEEKNDSVLEPEESILETSGKSEIAIPEGQTNIDFWIGWENEENNDASEKQSLNDNFALYIKDYSVDSFSVLPTKWNQNIVSWSSTSGVLQSLEPSDGVVTAKVSFQPLESMTNLIIAGRLTPYDILPVEYDSFIILVTWFLISLPMLWLIRIIRKRPFLNRGGLRFLAMLLILLAFISQVFYFIKDEPKTVITSLSAMGAICSFLSSKLPVRNQPRKWISFVLGRLIYVIFFLVPGLFLAYSEVIPQSVFYYGRLLSPGIMPMLLFLGILLIFKRFDETDRSEKFTASIGFLVFSGYVIGTIPNVFLVPIPFFLSLFLYSRLLMISPIHHRLLNTIKKQFFDDREQVYQNLEDSILQKRLERIKEQFISGETTLAKFRVENKKLESLISEEEDKLKIGGVKKEHLLFRFGPFSSNWKNGVWGAKHSLIICLPLIFFFVWIVSQQNEFLPSILETLVYFASRILVQIVSWIIAGFFFGYFFTYIKGKTGLKKGISFSLIYCCCFLPVWIISSISPIIILLLVAQVFLFYLVVGFWAFDYSKMQAVSGTQLTISKIAQIEGIPAFATFASAILTTIGVAVNSAFTGQLTNFITQIIAAIALSSQLPHK